MTTRRQPPLRVAPDELSNSKNSFNLLFFNYYLSFGESDGSGFIGLQRERGPCGAQVCEGDGARGLPGAAARV